jgi:hypothetical protein
MLDILSGIAENKRLSARAKIWLDQAKNHYELTGEKQRLFTSIAYGAKTRQKNCRPPTV